jgi:hypothetical protein
VISEVVGIKVGSGDGLTVGSGVGNMVGTRVGSRDGLTVTVGTRVGTRVGKVVGTRVGSGHISSSVVEHVRPEALHAVAPQHAKGVGAVQAEHDKVSLRSAGPAQLWQSKDPAPAYALPSGQRLLKSIKKAWFW